MSKPLYVFDMDDTLINGDCAMIWHQFLVEQGVVNDANFLEQDRRLMALYSQGKLNMNQYIEFAMEPLKALPKSQVLHLVERCVEKHILPKQFQQAKALIEQLQQDGIDMVIISASVSFIVEAVGNRIGIPQALGIDLIESEERFTAQIQGTASYREGKVVRLKQWLAEQNLDYSQIHFYTDSINDLALCEYADYSYLINPSSDFAKLGESRGWVIYRW